jgi:phospholipase C
MVSPTPPQNRAQGLSTVPTTNEIFRGAPGFPAGPYGVGVRVPMIVVSPWTRGGWVNSQLFDHTSLIRFLETRFARGNSDLIESNITPWRRAVVGDLTSTFDFKHPNKSARVRLPDTSDFKPVDLIRFPDEVPVPPTNQEVPDQERGVRPARAIPYTLQADAHAGTSSVSIQFKSSGGAAGVFHARSADPSQGPRSYTVESGKRLADSWGFTSGYDLSVYGPNGFFRHFKGTAGGEQAGLVIRASYGSHHDEDKIVLTLQNPGSAPAKVTVSDRYSSRSTALTIAPAATKTLQLSLHRTRGWYDLTVAVDNDGAFEYRYAGHLENGEASISDPGMGGLI